MIAAKLNRAGVPHRVIMELGGWLSMAMLLRYLGEAKPEEQRSAFDKLAGLP